VAEPATVREHDLARIDVGLDPNEASGLCPIESEALLDRLGWSEGYWTILDDGPIERCIAAIGRKADDEDAEPQDGHGSHGPWLVRRMVPPEPPEGWPDTDDGEAIATRDGVVYAFGSLYGAKEGPLELERQFVARFREDEVEVVDDPDLDDDHDPVCAPLEVVGDAFRLHRSINDALRDSGLPLLDPGPKVRKKTVGKARKAAIDDEAAWSHRLRWDDHPVNIEGATFLPSGALVLGLRIPVHADGHPLLVVVEGLERAFEEEDVHPRVVGVHVVANVGTPAAPTGVRDLAVRGGSSLHLLVGNLDSAGKGSVLLEALPEGVRAVSSQWHIDLDGGVLPSRDLGAVPDAEFPDLYRVEGLAYDPEGRPRYVVDEDERVGLRLGD
jgi:hypothetical protein